MPDRADLISRAAAIAEVEQWAEHGYDVIHWTGIKAMLEVQSTIDAIPVEWLREKMKWADDEGDLDSVDIFSWILQTWQKEQEAQDG